MNGLKKSVISFTFITTFCCASCFAKKEATFNVGEADSTSDLSGVSPLSTSGSTSYSSYLKHYFDNLTVNFGMNYLGSCGYVALGMILSYFDAFYSSTFVPSSYDVISSNNTSNLIDRRNSPGIKHDDFATMGYDSSYASSHLNTVDYLSYILAIENVSLHAKLISIANYLGYYDLSNPIYPASSTMSERVDVLTYYLENVLSLASTSYSIVTYTAPGNYSSIQSVIQEQIAEFIDDGYPVLISLTSSSNNKLGVSKHAAVAYDYNNSSLYYHPGLSGEDYSTHMTPSFGNYPYVYNYMVLIPSFTGNPGFNYSVEHFPDVIPNRFNDSEVNWESTHQHLFSNYIDYNDSPHQAFCNCGDYKLEGHTLVLSPDPLNPYITGHKCIKCNRRFP